MNPMERVESPASNTNAVIIRCLKHRLYRIKIEVFPRVFGEFSQLIRGGLGIIANNLEAWIKSRFPEGQTTTEMGRLAELFEHEGSWIDDDRSGASEQIKENLHSLVRSHDTQNGGFHPLKRPVSYENLVSSFNMAVTVLYLVFAKTLLQVRDDVIRNGRQFGAEMNNGADAGGILNLIQGNCGRKTGKQIPREQSINVGDNASAGRFAHAQAGTKDLDLFQCAQMRCGYMFTLRLRANTEPRGIGEVAGGSLA